jgi:AhpD family alkylhydroperoxidase
MRIDYFQLAPAIISKLRTITYEFNQFTIDNKLRVLIEARVSQINGCVYCVHLHLKDARTLGESQHKLDSLPVWYGSPFFDDREKAALAWAESLTELADTQAPEASFTPLKLHFSDLEIVELSIAISMANFWNRMASGFCRAPELNAASSKSSKYES